MRQPRKTPRVVLVWALVPALAFAQARPPEMPRRATRARVSLLLPGALMFGAVWVFSGVFTVVGLARPLWQPGPGGPPPPPEDWPIVAASTFATSLPVAGPLLLASVATTPRWAPYQSSPRGFLYAAAAAQAVGLVLLWLAALFPEDVPPKASPPAFRPLLVPTGNGVALVGSWP